MMRASLIIVVALIILLDQVHGQQIQLVAGHVLFRHGDRTPIATFPTDPYREADWPNGFGQLTTAGIEQHHRLGRYLRSRYGSLLNSNYTASEILVRSTDYDRTLMSAQSNLIGLYPVNNATAEDRVPIQPIPIHTVPMNEDFLLGIGACPRYDQIQEEVSRSDEVKQVNRYYEEFFRKLQRWTNLSSVSMYNSWDISDTVYVESIYNRTPSWADEAVRKNLSLVNELSFHFLFSNDDSKRIRGGPLIQDIWSNMNGSLHGKAFRKVKIYSAHDTTVSAALAFLGINYTHQPSYASALLIDLYRRNSAYFVKVEYINVTDSNRPYPYVLPRCPAYECPWETFTSIYEPRFPGSAESECARKSSTLDGSSRKVTIILLGVIISLVLIISVIFFSLYTRRSEHDPLLLTTDSQLQIS